MSEQASAAMRGAPRPLKERQREERAELILQAAEAVLNEKGYFDTSIDEIAARVGIAKGTVYLHYPSKEDLVVALIEREMKAFLAVVEELVRRPGSARERLESILLTAYTGIHGTQLFLLLGSSMEVRARLLHKQGGLRAHLDGLTASIGRVIEQGQAAGELDREIPSPVMLTTFLGLLSPKGYEKLLREDQLTPEDLVRAVGRIYFQGVAALST